MTAAEVKAALRGRHPAVDQWHRPSQWTCLDEWANIDLLAVSAWSKAPAAVGYEVKVSRSDLRRELLAPHKRAAAVTMCAEFYFAVPAGLLTADEIAYVEPEWETGDFDRPRCTAPDRERWHHRTRARCSEYVPVPCVLLDWNGEPMSEVRRQQTLDRAGARYHGSRAWQAIPCRVCGGKGTTGKSRVELDAPTCWVPRDVGLVEVLPSGRTRVARRAPRSKPDGLLASQQTRDLVRWASARPDPRHHERHRAALEAVS